MNYQTPICAQCKTDLTGKDHLHFTGLLMAHRFDDKGIHSFTYISKKSEMGRPNCTFVCDLDCLEVLIGNREDELKKKHAMSQMRFVKKLIYSEDPNQ